MRFHLVNARMQSWRGFNGEGWDGRRESSAAAGLLDATELGWKRDRACEPRGIDGPHRAGFDVPKVPSNVPTSPQTADGWIRVHRTRMPDHEGQRLMRPQSSSCRMQ